MGSPMIEKVARAICRSDYDGEDQWDGLNGLRYTYLENARAAIEAMREPTEAMLYAADGWTDLVGPYKEANTPEERRREFACAWDAMIDSALSSNREGGE